MRLWKDCFYPCYLSFCRLFWISLRIFLSHCYQLILWNSTTAVTDLFTPCNNNNSNIGNEVLSKPILKDLLKEFGWESVNNQVNGIEKKYIKTVGIQMYSESQLFLGLLLWGIIKDRVSLGMTEFVVLKSTGLFSCFQDLDPFYYVSERDWVPVSFGSKTMFL